MTSRNISQWDGSAHEVFVQQGARLFHYHREPQTLTDDGKSLPWESLSLDERNRLVAAARMAIAKLQTEAWMHEEFRRYFGKLSQYRSE